ncbi:MAPEG family protein [Thalassotalea psychrophila]|uniref:MAPEG family protein n=1 Tax=Thalassotalea psychrophila TaxID=3065647 RepID=A0ABY9TS43_9GAMM|nr:MAPEG family protein [Colwelliaceae bacterium SQ149]
MTTSPLVLPMITLMVLTAVVWVYMYILRLRYVIAHRISAQKLNSPEKIPELLPEKINRPANNLKNLFELPVIFYGLILLALITELNTPSITYLAWGFVGLRIIHSFIQCTNNNVMQRFKVYMLSAICLWALLVNIFIILI